MAHDRADRDGHDEIGAVATVALLAASMTAVPGASVRVVDEGKQRGEVRRGLEVDAAALAAVAPVRAPARDVGLPAERDCSGPPVATFDVDLGLVDESRRHAQAPDWAGRVTGGAGQGPARGPRRPRAALRLQFDARSVG